MTKIAIIGAGVSGLSALKQLKHYNPILFESTNSIGGVWKTCCYNSTKLQSPHSHYEFSDFPWPNRDDRSFPSHHEVSDYLESYVEHFSLSHYIKFNSKVVELKFIGDQDLEVPGREYRHPLPGRTVWEVAVRHKESATTQWYAFEFVVVCAGRYGDIPKIPEFAYNKGPQVFKGQVLHSIDYCKLDKESVSKLIQGKKVVIVGFKKSAIDLAMECAEANQGPKGEACTMIIRTLHWTVPHYRIWGLSFFLFFFSTRFLQFIHQTPSQSFLRSFLCLFLSPMINAVSKLLELYLLWKLPLKKYGLKPEHPVVEDYAACHMAVIPENFFSAVDKGKIVIKRASKWWFWNEGVEFEDKTKLNADVVILATGYDGKKKLKSILPDPFQSLLEYPSGMMSLYRGTTHPLIPNMAFVGYIESVSNLHTSEQQSMWLAQLIGEKFKLPSVEKMLEKVSKDIQVMKRVTRFYKRHCISKFSLNHSDEICEDGMELVEEENSVNPSI